PATCGSTPTTSTTATIAASSSTRSSSSRRGTSPRRTWARSGRSTRPRARPPAAESTAAPAGGRRPSSPSGLPRAPSRGGLARAVRTSVPAETMSLHDSSALKDSLRDARRRTLDLVADLGDDELRVPKLAIVNPLLWEIAHVAWFQEKWTLRRG